MGFKKLHWLPIIVFFWFPITFVITFIIATSSKHVYPFFPYISDTGTFTPESCIFGQMLNTGAVLLAFVIYIQYKIVNEAVLARNIEGVTTNNNRCLYFGFIASFGISIVGNFQETVQFTVHTIGAILAFGLGSVYLLLMCKISKQILTVIGTLWIIKLRLVLAIISFTCFMLTFLFAFVALTQFRGVDPTKWMKEHGGYNAHLISTINEWICCFSLMIYICTLSADFKQSELFEPDLRIYEKPKL